MSVTNDYERYFADIKDISMDGQVMIHLMLGYIREMETKRILKEAAEKGRVKTPGQSNAEGERVYSDNYIRHQAAVLFDFLNAKGRDEKMMERDIGVIAEEMELDWDDASYNWYMTLKGQVWRSDGEAGEKRIELCVRLTEVQLRQVVTRSLDVMMPDTKTDEDKKALGFKNKEKGT